MTFKVLAESLLENVHQTCQFFPNGPLEVMRGLHKQMLILFLSLHTNKKINLKICVETQNSVDFFFAKKFVKSTYFVLD